MVLQPFGWTRLTDASVVMHRFDGAELLLCGADPDAPPFSSARVRDGRGGFTSRPLAELGYAWARAKDGDGWALHTAGMPKTMARVTALWDGLAHEACAPLGLDPRLVLTTIACEVGAVRPDADGFVKAPRTERGYPSRTGERDAGDFTRDAEDWRVARGTHSSHGLMQTLIATATAARPDLFEGVDPAHYRSVLWSPVNALACGAAHLAGFAPDVLADPLRTRIVYGAGSVRAPASAPNLWGAVVYDDLVPLAWVAYWNDGATLEGIPDDDAPAPARPRLAWVFAAFSLFALSLATAWGASHVREHARR